MSEPINNPNPNPAPVPEPTPAKTFTQEEVDAMIGKRLAKAMKGIPSEEEIAHTAHGERASRPNRSARPRETRSLPTASPL